MRHVSLTLLGLLMFGCISLTPGGTSVKYVTKAEAPKECKLLGEVDIGSGAMGFEPQATNMRDAKILMRNKAAEMGANFLVIDDIESENGEHTKTYSASGRAYLCTDGSADG